MPRTSILILLFFSPLLLAQTLFTDLTAKNPWHQSLTYRLAPDIQIHKITAQLEKQAIPFENKRYTEDNPDTAVLILVDTSDPRRQRTIQQIGLTLNHFIQQANPYLKFGLARFDSDLTLIEPITDNRPKVQQSSLHLVAKGRTTELYRNTLKALEILAQTPAKRRVLWLFSDGIAEDTDYNSAEVIKFALEHQLIITSFGYPNSIQASIYLQSMRRFATTTGGLFMQANLQAKLPENTAQSLFKQLDNGGRLIFYFNKVQKKLKTILTVLWSSNVHPIEKKWTLIFPPAPQKIPPPSSNLTPFLIILILLMFWLLLRFYHHRKNPIIYGYIELIASGEKTAITNISLTIGRAKDNDLILANHSVSSYHAVLHQNRIGQWLISDLDSINGVYFKNKKVNHLILTTDDIFELGEVQLRLEITPEIMT